MWSLVLGRMQTKVQVQTQIQVQAQIQGQIQPNNVVFLPTEEQETADRPQLACYLCKRTTWWDVQREQCLQCERVFCAKCWNSSFAKEQGDQAVISCDMLTCPQCWDEEEEIDVSPQILRNADGEPWR